MQKKKNETKKIEEKKGTEKIKKRKNCQNRISRPKDLTVIYAF